jgi:hypothetical protein
MGPKQWPYKTIGHLGQPALIGNVLQRARNRLVIKSRLQDRSDFICLLLVMCHAQCFVYVCVKSSNSVQYDNQNNWLLKIVGRDQMRDWCDVLERTLSSLGFLRVSKLC